MENKFYESIVILCVGILVGWFIINALYAPYSKPQLNPCEEYNRNYTEAIRVMIERDTELKECNFKLRDFELEKQWKEFNQKKNATTLIVAVPIPNGSRRIDGGVPCESGKYIKCINDSRDCYCLNTGG